MQQAEVTADTEFRMGQYLLLATFSSTLCCISLKKVKNLNGNLNLY